MSYKHPKQIPFKLCVLFTIIFCVFCNPVDIIVGRQYQGQYTTNQVGDNFDYLKGRSGQLLAFFYGSPNRDAVNSAQFILLDPKYQDERVIVIDLKEIIDVNIQTGIWNSTHTLTYAKIWKQREGDVIKEDGVNTTITFKNLDSQDYEAVTISIDSKGSSFQFTAELTFYNQLISTLVYSLYVTGVTAIQIFSAFKLLSIMDAPNFVFCGKISLLTLSLCNIQDFSQTMTHIQYIMGSANNYLFFILPSLAYIVLFIIFDMKMLFLVWKSHNISYMDNPQLLRKKLTCFYIQFYLGLFIYLTLQYFFSYDIWMIVLTNLVLLPQIIHNVRIGQKPNFNPFYIFGYVGSRLLILFYERGCPQNRFKLSQNLTLFTILFSAYLLFVLLIALQNKLGSRFFVPKRFLPNYFEYRQKLKMDEENKGEDCAICLQNLFQNMNPTKEQESARRQMQDSLNGGDLLQQMIVMVTPCNHKFHVQCLTQWLDVKLQCPSCRTILPPL